MTQAEVSLQVLSEKSARNQMRSPVETNKAGEIKGATFTFEIASRQYLVIKLPPQAAKELAEHVKSLPPEKQKDFMRKWLKSNRDAAIEQYVRSRRPKQPITFELVPFKSIPMATVPSRTDRGQEAAEIAPDNRRYNVSEPTPTTAPESAVVVPQPQAKKPVPRPSEITGGMGMKEKPYAVAIKSGRESKGAGAQELLLPMRFQTDQGTTIYFEFGVTVSQLSEQNISRTTSEINDVILKTAQFKGIKVSVDVAQVKQNLRTYRKSVMAREAEEGGKTPIADYYLSHGGE